MRPPRWSMTSWTWLLTVTPAWADHPIDGATAPMSPLASALLFGGLTLVLGLVIIAVVRVLFSNRSGDP